MSWRSGRAYSQDLRDKVMAAFDAGEAAFDVAERFEVSLSFIYKADLRLEPHREAIMSHVARHPDATMAELRVWLAAEHGVSVCLATIWKTLDRFGLTFKKSRSGPPSRTAPMWRPRGKPGARSSTPSTPSA